MPIAKVQLPDGRIGRFEVPDGTTPDQVVSFAQGMGGQQQPEPAKPAEEPYTGSVLPFSRDAQGNTSFDPNAGIVGSIKRAFTAPGEALKGDLNPMSDEGRSRALETAMAISPLPAPMRAGERMIPGVAANYKAKDVAVPTAEELKAAASQAYTGARNSGAEYAGSAVKDMADTLRQSMESDGILAELSPKTFSILGRLQAPPAGSTANIQSLDAARKALGRAAGDFTNPTEQEAARRSIKAIDDFISSSGASRPMAGASPAPGAIGPTESVQDLAARLINEARGNTASLKRSERITGAQDTAELNAAAANSGQNVDNATRQRLKAILTNPKQARGFNDQELAAIEEVVRGTASTNTLRFVGNLLGGGGGLGAMVTGAAAGAAGGAATGGLPGVIAGMAIPAVGYGSRRLANALTSREVGNIDEMVRMRSPLYEQRAATPGTTPDALQASAMLTKLLMSGALNNDPGGRKLAALLMSPAWGQEGPGNQTLTKQTANSSSAAVFR